MVQQQFDLSNKSVAVTFQPTLNSHLRNGSTLSLNATIANQLCNIETLSLIEIIEFCQHNFTLLSAVFNHPSSLEWLVSEIDPNSISTFDYIINGVATLVIAVTCVISNIVGITFVSSGIRKGKLFNLLLAAMFASNTLFSVFSILRCVDSFYLAIPAAYLHTFMTIANSGIRFSMTCSVLYLVAIAHARLAVTRRPVQNQTRNLSVNKTRSIFLKYSIPIIFVSTLMTSPLYWETEEDFSQLLGGTTIIVPTAFRTSAIYSIFYTGFLNLGILGIFPLISLSYFNFHIIKELRTNRERLAKLHIHILINGKARDAEQKMLSQSLIFTIFIFIFLHAILHIFNVIAELMIITIQNKEVMGVKNFYVFPTFYYFTCSISEFFMIVYATVNVMLYLYPHLSKFFVKLVRTNVLSNNIELSDQTRNNTQESVINEIPSDISNTSLRTIGEPADNTLQEQGGGLCPDFNCKFCALPNVERLI